MKMMLVFTNEDSPRGRNLKHDIAQSAINPRWRLITRLSRRALKVPASASQGTAKWNLYSASKTYRNEWGKKKHKMPSIKSHLYDVKWLRRFKGNSHTRFSFLFVHIERHEMFGSQNSWITNSRNVATAINNVTRNNDVRVCVLPAQVIEKERKSTRRRIIPL